MRKKSTEPLGLLKVSKNRNDENTTKMCINLLKLVGKEEM